jgi:SAM-dependent methyltransferase
MSTRQVLNFRRAGRLVYLDAKATPEFWDARWQAEGRAGRSRQDEAFARITARHLPPGSRVLEGGCGRANKVKALADAGFAAVGVDYAAESVEFARQIYPGLDIRVGDVRSLPFPDGCFDGYWSIGVIEHFWTGYDDILGEARRVLKPDGRLFLTTRYARRWPATVSR